MVNEKDLDNASCQPSTSETMPEAEILPELSAPSSPESSSAIESSNHTHVTSPSSVHQSSSSSPEFDYPSSPESPPPPPPPKFYSPPLAKIIQEVLRQYSFQLGGGKKTKEPETEPEDWAAAFKRENEQRIARYKRDTAWMRRTLGPEYPTRRRALQTLRQRQSHPSLAEIRRRKRVKNIREGKRRNREMVEARRARRIANMESQINRSDGRARRSSIILETRRRMLEARRRMDATFD